MLHAITSTRFCERTKTSWVATFRFWIAKICGPSIANRGMRYGWLTMVVMLTNAGPVVAGPHEHGVVYLDIAIEGQVVSLSVRGAGDGFVGFERSPRTDEERRLVETASIRLQQGGRQFMFDTAVGCQQTAADVEVPQGGKGKQTHHHGPDDSHHHDHHVGAKTAHRDWSATWEFRCDQPRALRALQVNLFDDFPGIHEVRVQLISDAWQTSTQLTPTSRRLMLISAS